MRNDDDAERVNAQAISDLILAQGRGIDLTDERTISLRVERILPPDRGWEREHVLEATPGVVPKPGRIDFYLPIVGLGVELKARCGPSALATQLLAYAYSPEILALVLVTANARTARGLPDTLNGKPLVVCELWRAVL